MFIFKKIISILNKWVNVRIFTCVGPKRVWRDSASYEQ